MIPVYAFLVSSAVWTLLLPWHLLLVALGRCSRSHLAQRLGRQEPPPVTQPRILIHAVSVGEVAVAAAIIRELTHLCSALRVILTTGNQDGLRAAQRFQAGCPAVAAVSLLPWDRPGAMRRWLVRWRPRAVAVVETEIWPGLFLGCRALDVPLCIVNGRVYPADVARYRIARPFFRRVLSVPGWIGVQDDAERERFIAIGASPDRVQVVGNAKYDLPSERAELPEPWTKSLPKPSGLVVAGSTHHPEERWLVEALLALRPRFPGLKLVLAPRRVSRSRSVGRRSRAAGLAVRMWSDPPSAGQSWDLMVLDELGWLGKLYARAGLAVVGGSFVPRGGHNLLEAARHGGAVVIGPSTHHFHGIVQRFARAGGLVQVQSRAGLRKVLDELLSDPERRRQLGHRARELWESGRGAAAEYARRLARMAEGGDDS